MSETPGLIYVGGYGRSGPTLLDLFCSNHQDVFGGGELTWLFRDALSGALCSCGEGVSECSFWRTVFTEVRRLEPAFDLKDAAHLTLKSERLFGKPSLRPRYQKLWRNVFRAIRAVSGKSFIVDSSKVSRLTFHRLGLLLDDLDNNIALLHLVRDPRGVMWSCKKGSNRRLESGVAASQFGGIARGLCGWVFANWAVEDICRRRAGVKKLLIRYEDFASDSTRELRRIADWISLPASDKWRVVDNDTVLKPGHGIAGNRMRRQGEIRLQLDEQWRDRLPLYGRLLAMTVSRQMRSYGYE